MRRRQGHLAIIALTEQWSNLCGLTIHDHGANYMGLWAQRLTTTETLRAKCGVSAASQTSLSLVWRFNLMFNSKNMTDWETARTHNNSTVATTLVPHVIPVQQRIVSPNERQVAYQSCAAAIGRRDSQILSRIFSSSSRAMNNVCVWLNTWCKFVKSDCLLVFITNH